jgi:hypothetical protein
MKQHLRKLSVLILIAVLLLANPVSVLADEGEGGHGMEVEVNDYHVTLSSLNEWVKGENIIVVTITDAMGMPVSDAQVEILIAQKKADSHTAVGSYSHGEAETDAHAEPQVNTHAPEPSRDSMEDMDDHEEENSEPVTHEEQTATPLVMTESHEHGEYVLETHLDSSGEHVVQVFFHVDGETMQADFTVDVPGMASKTVVLWSFLLLNVGLVVSAGVFKTQSVTAKGK